MVRGYAATIDPAGKFYRENRFPAYIYDKLVCGLADAHAWAHDPMALPVLERATQAALPYLPPKAMPHRDTPVLHHEDFTEHCWDESYTLPENLFIAFRLSGDEQYRTLARRFLYNDGYFDPLARGENVLPGKHAYSHVNALSSAARAYFEFRALKYFRAAQNGFRLVSEQSFATGGWGPDEHFVEPGSGKLGDSLTGTHASFETPCGAYAHFKITRYLLQATRNSRYGDSMERVLYNTILGAKPIQPDGRAFYYSDYNFHGHKSFHPDKWPCCSGTLPQIAADYRISAYLGDTNGLYVNLFVPSTVAWTQGGAKCSLRQTTNYPYESRIAMEVDASVPARFSVFLRIPEWATDARVSVNRQRGTRKAMPGTFAEIRREWRNGDRIELELPLTMRFEPVDAQHPDTLALLSGPLVLMALTNGERPAPQKRTELLTARQISTGAHDWVNTSDPPLRLKPFLDIQDQPYTTYLQVHSG